MHRLLKDMPSDIVLLPNGSCARFSEAEIETRRLEGPLPSRTSALRAKEASVMWLQRSPPPNGRDSPSTSPQRGAQFLSPRQRCAVGLDRSSWRRSVPTVG